MMERLSKSSVLFYHYPPNFLIFFFSLFIFLFFSTTRTWHFGTPTQEEIRAYTRVLQGHIAIDTAVFPRGTTGYILDVLARKALWLDGLDYSEFFFSF